MFNVLERVKKMFVPANHDHPLTPSQSHAQLNKLPTPVYCTRWFTKANAAIRIVDIFHVFVSPLRLQVPELGGVGGVTDNTDGSPMGEGDGVSFNCMILPTESSAI